ncbi:16S rRNA methyltransferase B [Listeria rocourtiae FSL F6-920]|nr:16S rRNA methyltransferase B [Listeria rocourtiae FSL F6-920]
MKKPETVREIALDLIEKIENNQSFSHLLINDALKNSNLNQMDRALLTELVYGTTQRRITLDFYLEPFFTKDAGKLGAEFIAPIGISIGIPR